LAILLLLGLTFLAHLPGLVLGQHRAALDPHAVPPSASRSTHQPEASSEATTNQAIVLPAMRSAGQVLGEGNLPLWNRRGRFGEPFSVSGATLLYPPFWVLMLKDGYRLLDWVLFLHSFMACLFMYRFLRVLPLSRYVAFIGGGGYGMGWFLTTQMDRLPEAAAAALLPLALEMTWRLLVSHQRELVAALLALAVALMFLTGGVVTAAFGTLLCAALFTASLGALAGSDRRRAYRTITVATLLAILLTAPQWLDAMQHRGELADAPPQASHLQLGGFLNAFAPTALGGLRGEGPDALKAINPDADPLELVLYPGALPLCLLLLGLFRPKRTYHGLFWVLAGGTGLLLAMDSPIVDLFSRLTGWGAGLPGASLVLTHVAFVVLSSLVLEGFFDAPARRDFAVPLTAGLVGAFVLGVAVFGFIWPTPGLGILKLLGADGVQTELAAGLHHMRRQLLVTAGILAMTGGLFLAWRRLGILRFKAALAVIAFIDLLGVSLLHVPRVDGQPMTEAYASYLPATDGRVMSAIRTPLPPASWLMARGFSTVSTAGTGILRNTADYLSLVDPSAVRGGRHSQIAPLFVPQLLDHPLLTCASVVLGVAGRPFQIDGHRPLTAAPGVDSTAPDLFIAERDAPLPRARILFQVKSVDSEAEAREFLRQYPHTLAETLVLVGHRPEFEPRRPGIPPQIEFQTDQANLVRLRVDMGQGRGYLLLADALAPGWVATIDGVETAVLQADLAFRAVPVPEGEHVVEFRYSPRLVRVGFPLGFLGLLLCIGWTLLARRRMEHWLRPDV
jgi:hypothetical protein